MARQRELAGTGTIIRAPMLTTHWRQRGAADDPLCLLWSLPCSCRASGANRRCRRVRHWLSRHVRRSLRSRWVAGRFARVERVPSHISAIFPLRPISPMESAIHDVRCAVTARKSRRWVENSDGFSEVGSRASHQRLAMQLAPSLMASSSQPS